MFTQTMLTTFDNPYDPFDHFDEWYLFDLDNHYYSCSRLARIARTSSQLSEIEYAREIERAIDEIIKYDPTNNFKKVSRTVSDDGKTVLEMD